MRAAGHEVVARAFWRGLGEHRGFDVDESVFVHVAAHRHRDAVAQAQALAHLGATQVEVAVTQPHFLADVLVELERQRLGLVQHGERAGQQLHLARGEVGVGGAGRPGPHQAAHLDDELAAQALGLAEQGLVVRIEHDLQQALAVAQVDEDHPAMIAAPVHPAGDGNFLTRQLFIDLAAIMTTHRTKLLLDWRWKIRSGSILGPRRP